MGHEMLLSSLIKMGNEVPIGDASGGHPCAEGGVRESRRNAPRSVSERPTCGGAFSLSVTVGDGSKPSPSSHKEKGDGEDVAAESSHHPRAHRGTLVAVAGDTLWLRRTEVRRTAPPLPPPAVEDALLPKSTSLTSIVDGRGVGDGGGLRRRSALLCPTATTAAVDGGDAEGPTPRRAS